MARFTYGNPPSVNELVRVLSTNFTDDRHGRTSDMLKKGDLAKIKEIISQGRSASIYQDEFTYDIRDFEPLSPTDEELLNSTESLDTI